MARLSEKRRRAMIIQAGLQVISDDGFYAVNFQSVSSACQIDTSESTIKRLFGTADRLLADIVSTDPELEAEAMRQGYV